jgi:hypothetical protein
MKIKHFACFTAAWLAWIINGIAYSQRPNGIATVELRALPETNIPFTQQIHFGTVSNPIFRNNISIKAMRNFTRDYENVSDVEWFRSDNGFAVYFTMDGVKTKVLYYKNGDYKSMYRYYSEDKLPREICHLVKSKYFDFSIFCISEFNMNNQTIYEIKMEDKISWITIKVVDGVIESTQEYFKQSAGKPE